MPILPDVPAAVSTALIDEYIERGFVLGGRLLDEPAVDRLRAELERVIRDAPALDPAPVLVRNLAGGERPVWQIVNIWQASPVFAELLHHPALLAMAGALSGARELRIWHDQIQYKPRATGGVNMWHQDAPYWPILSPMDAQITAWIALDDVDEDNGCMSMVVGSHRWGNQIDLLHTLRAFESMPEDFGGQRIVVERRPVRAGHVHFHHPLTWHGSHANSSARPRRAIALHFMTERTTFVAGGDHVMKPFVGVPDGTRLQGGPFELVWRAA